MVVAEDAAVSSRVVGGALMASTTASTPSSAASKPWPVVRSTPSERLMRMASCPSLSRAETVRAPILPVAPATAIRMVSLLRRELATPRNQSPAPDSIGSQWAKQAVSTSWGGKPAKRPDRRCRRLAMASPVNCVLCARRSTAMLPSVWPGPTGIFAPRPISSTSASCSKAERFLSQHHSAIGGSPPSRRGECGWLVHIVKCGVLSWIIDDYPLKGLGDNELYSRL